MRPIWVKSAHQLRSDARNHPERVMRLPFGTVHERKHGSIECMMASNRVNISSASFWSPEYLSTSAWLSHVPFAFWLTEAIRPRRFVELGTHTGLSFFAFCQAVKRLGLNTKAFAVDTWKGDEHAGFYGEEVYGEVLKGIAPYDDFAALVRSTFDDALGRFAERSIDLLHIDGLHRYEDVKHDYESWRPKLSDDAVVLFHDTHERARDFGVWRLFEELSADHPSFQFWHGHGLGVLCPGTVRDGLQGLMGADPDVEQATRLAYATLGSAVAQKRQATLTHESLAAVLSPDGLASLVVEGAEPILLEVGAALAKARADAETARRAREAAAAEVADLGARLAESRTGEAAALAAQRRGTALNRLLRRSLLAKREQVGTLRQALNQRGAREALVLGALEGRVGRAERERQGGDERRSELLRWGQGLKRRLDAVLVQLEVEVQARSRAEERLGALGRGRLARAMRKVRRSSDHPRDMQGAALPNGGEQARLASALRNTGLFDEAYYLASNADVAAEGIDAVSHFAETGWWEGRRPNPTFDPLFYLAANEDVSRAGVHPLIHYAEQGIVEGRRPAHASVESRWIRPSGEPLSPSDEAAIEAVLDTGLFDHAFYRDDNPDVVGQGMDPVVHYALDGWREGRRPNPSFDPSYYCDANPDVAATGMDPLVHYATRGIAEGRRASREAAVVPGGGDAEDDSDRRLAAAVLETGLFDADYYRASNPDVAAVGGEPALHFARDGWNEGRRPNPDFDPKFYLDQNPDVAAMGTNPLLHFADYGLFEGRSPSREGAGVTGAADGAEGACGGYARWVALHDTLTEADRRAIKARLVRLDYKPLISVIMPVYDPPVAFLRQAVASVQSQLYENWELCIADDASPNHAVRDVLREMAKGDARIKLVERAENGHISAASNAALALATGEFLALLDHDDVLPDHALFEVVACLNERQDLDVIYSDEDHIDASGNRRDPYFKTDYNHELINGHNMINHLGVYRSSLVKGLGGFRLGYEGSQDYDLALRAIDASSPSRIHHIPAILYHWRSTPGDVTFSQTFLERCTTSARQALADHLQRRGQAGRIVAHPSVATWHRVERPLPEPVPLVSIIVPTRDKAEVLAPCCDGILNRTDYPNFELIIVDHQSTEPETVALLAELARDQRVRILPYEGIFNYSAINNAAVKLARGSIVTFLNNDVDVIGSDWLAQMVALACLPDVGAVGAKLLYPDDRVQHAGVVLGVGGVAGHLFHLHDAHEFGVMGRAVLTADVSAVTGACLVVRKSLFEAVGGFDADNLPVAFNDVDLCLKMRQTGVRNVLTPHAVLYHHESLSRGSDLTGEKQARFKRECDFMMEKWGDDLLSDPFYNPNLSLASADFALSWPPRRQKPWKTAQ